MNKTTVPYNQTIIGTENSTKSQPQASNQTGQSQTNQTGQSQTNQTGQQQAGTASPVGGQGHQQSQNQSKGPLNKLSSSVGNLLGGKK